jgi:antitoxin VapB
MALSIKSDLADQLARQLAALTGESLTAAVIAAIREKLEMEQRKRRNKEQLIADICAISQHCASLPVLDNRTEEEIMGWDENGLPS